MTQRQKEVLDYVRRCKVTGTGYDGSVLWALQRKGLVRVSHNSAPGYVYYTWTLTDAGQALADANYAAARLAKV